MGTPHNISTGKMEEALLVLWQIVALWIDEVLLDKNMFDVELGTVQERFRKVIKLCNVEGYYCEFEGFHNS